MATLSAWMFTMLQGADEVLAKLEKLSRDQNAQRGVAGLNAPKTVVPLVGQFCEGACEHELRP